MAAAWHEGRAEELEKIAESLLVGSFSDNAPIKKRAAAVHKQAAAAIRNLEITDAE